MIIFCFKNQKVEDKHGFTTLTDSLLNSYIRELSYYEKCAQTLDTEKAKSKSKKVVLKTHLYDD